MCSNLLKVDCEELNVEIKVWTLDVRVVLMKRLMQTREQWRLAVSEVRTDWRQLMEYIRYDTIYLGLHAPEGDGQPA